MLHRDVKPGNILVAKDGRVKVTDFGIGKFTGATTSELTRTGHMVGSPAYMSPEQVKGEKLDGRSDLFSLGIVLYELLTGARPFPGESITTLVYQILHTEPRDPLEWKADLPVATREVIARILAKAPEKRPADAAEFVRELARIEKIQRESEMVRRALADASPTAPVAAVPSVPAGSPPLPSSPPRRSGMPVILAALAVLVAVSFFLLRERQRGVEPLAPGAVRTAPPAPTAEPTAAPEPTVAAEPSAVTEVAQAAVPTAAPATPKPRATPRRRPTPAPGDPVPVQPPSAPAPAAPAVPARPERVDAEYTTRRAVRFTSSPEQARLYLDGRYIGIADDWDNRGGGRELEFPKPGTHYVRMELPGYRSLVIEIDVAGESSKDSPSIDEEMDRRDRAPFEKLSPPADRTTAAVEFAVEPPEATVSEAGKALGPAASFGPGSPLQLEGPTVHDLVLAAPGYKSKLVRILVAANAGKDRAKVKESLKKE